MRLQSLLYQAHAGALCVIFFKFHYTDYWPAFSGVLRHFQELYISLEHCKVNLQVGWSKDPGPTNLAELSSAIFVSGEELAKMSL